MAWYSAEELQKKFNFKLDDPTGDEPIEFAQESSADDLEDWLKPEDFALLSGEDQTGDTLKKQKRIIRAHAYLTIYYIFLNNTQIRASGTVDTEKGFDDNTTTKYFKPKELKELREQYLEQAQNLIAGFAIVSFGAVIETTAVERIPSGSVPVEYVF